MGNKAEGGVVAPRVQLRAGTHSLNVRLSNSPWLLPHSVETLSMQSMGFKLQLISLCRCILKKELGFHGPHGSLPYILRRELSYAPGILVSLLGLWGAASHIRVEPAPPLLLWSMGSQLPAQLIRQNGAQSIQKLKSCLKVIPHASSHTQFPARPSSSPDVAITEAVSTHSLRCHFNHKLVGTDSYRTHHLAITAYSPACFPFCTPHDNCCLSSWIDPTGFEPPGHKEKQCLTWGKCALLCSSHCNKHLLELGMV